MEAVTYTILKQAGDQCGMPTDFRLFVQPEAGISFESFEVLETEGLYTRKIKVNFNETGPNSPPTITLCNAPVVCYPESQLITIVTNVAGDPQRSGEKDDDYNQAQVGGKLESASAAG